MSSIRIRAALCVSTLALVGVGCGAKPDPTPKPEQADASASEPAASVAAEPGEAGPKIACDEATFDFGTVTPSGTVTHVFKIENTGTADLRIEKVEKT